LRIFVFRDLPPHRDAILANAYCPTTSFRSKRSSPRSSFFDWSRDTWALSFGDLKEEMKRKERRPRRIPVHDPMEYRSCLADDLSKSALDSSSPGWTAVLADHGT